MKKSENYLNKIDAVCQQYQPMSVYLYGSYANGTPRKDSDIDLLVITQKENNKLYKEMMSEFWDFEVPVEMVMYDKKTIKEKLTWNHLVQNILENGKLIYGQAIK